MATLLGFPQKEDCHDQETAKVRTSFTKRDAQGAQIHGDNSPRSVDNAKVVQASGDNELIEAVETDEITVSAMASEARWLVRMLANERRWS